MLGCQTNLAESTQWLGIRVGFYADLMLPLLGPDFQIKRSLELEREKLV